MPNATILVVDDSPTEMILIRTPLEKKGYRLLTAENGEEALLKAAKELPNLILLDVVMPKMNGFQVCRKLKNTQETKNIKVILLTSKGQESDRFWGMKQGADEYITKPFKDDELLDNVSKFL